MRVERFAYDLPPELVAQKPASDREGARLLVLEGEGALHRTIADLPEHVPPGSLVVVNDTKVIRARILGVKEGSGGKAEIFLVSRLPRGPSDHESARGGGVGGSGAKPLTMNDPSDHESANLRGERGCPPFGGSGAKPLTMNERWKAMARASKPLRLGARVVAEPLVAEVTGKADDGLYIVTLTSLDAAISLEDALQKAAQVPLPPYIKRAVRPEDEERYQTVYARAPGAVAAPTAGLHLTTPLLRRLEARGCEIAACTLHVGLGTFEPVKTDDLDDHPMHAEYFEISRALAAAVARARERGGPVLAVGTTVVRALESAADPERDGHVRPCAEETRILIQPGHRLRVVDRLLTNFHLPQSTLLALVCAFSGTERVLEAYRLAIRERYRFFSYGDAMLLERA